MLIASLWFISKTCMYSKTSSIYKSTTRDVNFGQLVGNRISTSMQYILHFWLVFECIKNNPFSLPTRHILKLGQDRFFIAFWCSRYPFIVTFWREGSSVVLNRKPLASICRCDVLIDCVMLLWQAIVFCVSRDRLRHAMGWGVSFSMWS